LLYRNTPDVPWAIYVKSDVIHKAEIYIDHIAVTGGLNHGYFNKYICVYVCLFTSFKNHTAKLHHL